MELLDKVKVNPEICHISLDFDGGLNADYSKAAQNFYNSKENGNNWNKTHFGKTTVSFQEDSKTSDAGESFTQTLSIKFPSNDDHRSDRIAFFKFVKFIKLDLTNGAQMVLGRNDYFQNKTPKVTTRSTHKFTTVTFVIESIFAAGFVLAGDGSVTDYLNELLPHDIPITFINI